MRSCSIKTGGDDNAEELPLLTGHRDNEEGSQRRAPSPSVDVMKKSAKVRAIGTKRVNSALKIIAGSGNLSNRQSYAYSG